MRKYLILISFLTLIINSNGQNRVIYGKVQYKDTVGLPGVSVLEKGTSNSTMTYDKGKFKICLVNEYKPVLVFSYIGLETKEIKIEDTLKLPLTVQLEENEPKSFEIPKFKLNKTFFTVGFEKQKFNFNNFNEFQDKDIDLFNQMFFTFLFNLSTYYRNFYGDISVGVNYAFYTEDSLKTSVDFKKSSFSFGYGFHDQKNRLIFTPFISLVRNNFKYLKYEESEQTTLTNYLQTKYLHLKLIQYNITAGAKINIKIFSLKDGYKRYPIFLSLGSGYSVKLSKYPIVKSPNHRLYTNKSLSVDNLVFNAGVVMLVF